jgi:hypothetical protein
LFLFNHQHLASLAEMEYDHFNCYLPKHFYILCNLSAFELRCDLRIHFLIILNVFSSLVQLPVQYSSPRQKPIMLKHNLRPLPTRVTSDAPALSARGASENRAPFSMGANAMQVHTSPFPCLSYI